MVTSRAVAHNHNKKPEPVVRIVVGRAPPRSAARVPVRAVSQKRCPKCGQWQRLRGESDVEFERAVLRAQCNNCGWWWHVALVKCDGAWSIVSLSEGHREEREVACG